jgi:hypothetical protein
MSSCGRSPGTPLLVAYSRLPNSARIQARWTNRPQASWFLTTLSLAFLPRLPTSKPREGSADGSKERPPVRSGQAD